MRIQVTSKGKKPLNFIEDVSTYFHAEIQERLADMGQETAERMREVIRTSKKRPSFGSNLEDTIQSDILDSTAGIEIRIGNVNALKSDAPYWEVLNNGGYTPFSTEQTGCLAAPPGSFEGNAPIKGGSGQHWERTDKQHGFYMKPIKAIEGIRYIEIAVKDLENKLNTETKAWIISQIDKQAKS
jgi:hypothetical protein